MTYKEKIKLIADSQSDEQKYRKLAEEISELLALIHKALYNQKGKVPSRDQFISEIADVLVCIEKIKEPYTNVRSYVSLQMGWEEYLDCMAENLSDDLYTISKGLRCGIQTITHLDLDNIYMSLIHINRFNKNITQEMIEAEKLKKVDRTIKEFGLNG